MRSHPTAARRGAKIVAAAGLLIASTGVAVMTTVATANAADQIIVCHATTSDSNPYRVVLVDDNSTLLEAHMEHQEAPNKIWKTAGDFNGVPHAAGDPKPDLIGVADVSACSDSNPPEDILVEADVTFVDPSCENGNTASYTTTTGEYSWTESAPAAPGAEITVTATVNDGHTFAEDEQTYSETHAFGSAVDLDAPPCARVDPPVVDPPVVQPPIVLPPEQPVVDPPVAQQKTPTVVPSVVKAGFGTPGLSGSTAMGLDDTGFALVAFGGGLLLMGAAGMGFTRRRETRA